MDLILSVYCIFYLFFLQPPALSNKVLSWCSTKMEEAMEINPGLLRFTENFNISITKLI